MYRKSRRAPNVLLVEDNPADAMLLETALNEINDHYMLHLASDGEEAIRYLLREDIEGAKRPDLILLDLNLPKVHGHEVLRVIKSNDQLKAIPVLILTSSKAPSDITGAYRSGANSYLEKPVDLDATIDLARTIHHYWLDLALLPGPV